MDANELYQNPRMIRLRFEERFGEPLDTLLTDLTKGEVADRSPIMEMIRNVAYKGEFRDETAKRRLILISDMLQHMPEYSHYRTPVDYEAFAKSRYFEQVRPSLPGVEVRVIYLIRRGRESIQTAGHAVFWERFFKAAGAIHLNEIRVGP